MKKFKAVFLGCYAALPMNFVRIALMGCEVFCALALISLALQYLPDSMGLGDATRCAQSIGASAARIPVVTILVASAMALAELLDNRGR